MGAEANAGAVNDAAAGSTNVDGTEVDVTSTDGANGTDDKGAAKTGDDTDGLKKALAAERKARAQAEKTLREQELAKLPELERFKTENETLSKENEKLSLENKKLLIGIDLGLSLRNTKRLVGDTEEEMRADAAEMIKEFKSKDDSDDDPKDKRRPTNDARKSGGSSSTKPDINRLLRAAAGKGK